MVAQTMTVRNDFAPGALALSEQAVHLLRRNPAALADYYIGALPFVLGMLFFWSDMSRNPDAGSYCAPTAAGLAALFMWMKLWQARFCRRLTGILNDAPPEHWSKARCWRTAARQALLQATGLLVLPLAALIMLPLGWVYAFYQNAAVLDGPATRQLKGLYKAAWQQAALWPGQNHLLLTIFSLFATFVLADIAMGLMLVPYLLKWLLGIETAFTFSGMHAMTNTTFLAIVVALTYLCIDPLIKAAYTLRCFSGLSRRTGDDLLAVLKPFLKVAVIAMVLWAGPVSAAQMSPAERAAQVPAVSAQRDYSQRLDDTIQQVLQQRRFAWRLPREKSPAPPPDERSWLTRTLRWFSGIITAFGNSVNRWIESLAEWLGRRFPQEEDDRATPTDWHVLIGFIFYGIGAGLVMLLLITLRRWFRSRLSVQAKTGSTDTAPPIDINDEEISAEDLPRDRWLSMAQELIARGDLRQALRALYLSVLAQLGDSGRVRLARFKSNRDYLNELVRRVHAEPELLTRFDRCMAAFERAWYGMHPVTAKHISDFKGDQARIFFLVQHAATVGEPGNG
ncbi:MAG: hypothetical protein VR64_07980 [Desulfatitalea sp. BRH_c12]|nr:MAG: hypothetical protein VR64_07980 [Desulfatitalea sp. BRH_c12]